MPFERSTTDSGNADSADNALTEPASNALREIHPGWPIGRTPTKGPRRTMKIARVATGPDEFSHYVGPTSDLRSLALSVAGDPADAQRFASLMKVKGTVSLACFRSALTGALEFRDSLPLLEKSDFQFVLTNKFGNVWPKWAASLTEYGTPNESNRGVMSGNTIIVKDATVGKSPYDLLKLDKVDQKADWALTAGHEISHEVDFLHGWVSEKKAFTRAYRKDVAQLPTAVFHDQEYEHYLPRRSGAYKVFRALGTKTGAREAFAELSANTRGLVSLSSEDLRPLFPRSCQVLAGDLSDVFKETTV